MASATQDDGGFVFVPGKEETLLGRIRLRYSTKSDCYFSGTCEDFTNRPRRIGNSITELAYSYDNIERVVTDDNQVYIDRKSKDMNGRISWRFNFASSGLVLDKLTMKMSYQENRGGQVIVSVNGDSVGSKAALYCSSDVFMTITRLEGSSSLTITVNMNGENEGEMTRVLSEEENTNYHLIEYPFDFQIRLKRPDFTIGRSLVFIGLMYSHKELPTAVNIKEQKRSKGGKKENNEEDERVNVKKKGFLNILIHKAKRLPCRENGAYAEPKVKCTLFGKGTSQKVKTRAIGKTLNPTWNERLVLSNVELDQLRYTQLELQVVHAKSMFKIKSSETLGYIVLQRQNTVGTWRKPVCRNHSVRRPEMQQNPHNAAGAVSKKISNVSHFVSTENIFLERNMADVVEEKNPNDEEEDHRDDDKETYAKTKTDTSMDKYLLANQTAAAVNYTKNNNKFDIFDLPDLKESTVDDLQEAPPSYNHICGNINETFDSDMVNITFRDESVQNLILQRTHSQKTTSSNEDESFEILPNFPTTKQVKVLQIGNTIGESETDRHHQGQEYDQSSEHETVENLNSSEIYHLNMNKNGIDDLETTNTFPEELNQSTFTEDAMSQDISKTSIEIQPRVASVNNMTSESIVSVADLSTVEESEMDNKRRCVSVDNSQLTPSRTRRFKINQNNSNSENNNNNNNNRKTKVKPELQRAHSMSDLLDINKKREKKFNKRKGFSSKLYRSGSISNILDDFFEEKAKRMSHDHWSMVIDTPDRWFYCWHPLLGVNNLLSNWQ